ncbi:MAG: hypothetical protein KGD64_13875 [Candidatus Heimdallarchaeota archaeon]|nr:hypothetical protein [Candidatus Heimdallarchaeota archaeon]
MYEVKQEVIDWLLEDNNPPICYLTQIDLLDSEVKDPKIDDVRRKINSYQPTKEILENQKEKHYWFEKEKDKNYKKYLGSFWQLLFLYELHAQRNEQISNGIEHVLITGQAPNGGFSISGTNSGTIPCLTANMIRMLIYFDYWKDERTRNAVEYILTKLEDKDGFICFPLTSLIKNCYMTMPKILHALSSIPEKDQTPRIRNGINICVQRILENQVFKYVPERNKEWLKYIIDNKIKGEELFKERSKFLEEYPSKVKVAKTGWIKFGFPLNYNSDILDTMRALASLGINYKPEMANALEIIKNKAVNGKWVSEKQYKSPMYVQIEEYGKESKWITFHALTVLKHFEGITIV